MDAVNDLDSTRRAAAAGRWREACELLETARSAAGGLLPRADLELLGEAAFLRGRRQLAIDALTRAHELHAEAGDAAAAARTAGRLALQLLEAGDVTQSGTWVARGTRIVRRMGDAHSAGGFVALVPAAFNAAFLGELEEGMRRFDDIADIAARTNDPELAVYATFGRGKCLIALGLTTEGLTLLDDAMTEVAAGHVPPSNAGSLYRVALDTWHEAFDLDRAVRWTSEFGAWCDATPELVTFTGLSHAYRAQLALLAGRWVEASSHAHGALESVRAGDFTAVYVANYQWAELCRLRGELRPAEEHYRRAAETGWEVQPGLALLRLASGDVDAAQTMLRNSVVGADEATVRRMLPATVQIELAAGDIVAARTAADELVAFAKRAPTRLLAAVAAFALSSVTLAEGEAETALAQAAVARSRWAVLRAPLQIARCDALAGACLAALGMATDAEAEFDRARAVFADLGAQTDLADLDRASGDRRPAHLTPREVEVLRLVSTGLTNRAIGERLSLSEKTVARHLSNIFLKLGLNTRAAATAFAYEHGLV